MADETIVTNIVATSNFSSLISDVNRVTASLAGLQRQLSATDKIFANQIAKINASFANTLSSSGQFSTHFVSLSSDAEKFGKSLETGRLKLRDYFNTLNTHATTSGGLIRDLAKQQVQLQNAIVQPLGRNAQGLMQYNIHVARGLDEVANKTKIAQQQAAIMNRVIQQGANQLINWGKNTQWAGRQLTVGLTVPIVAFGKAAADAFATADQQLVRLTKVYGDIAGTSASELRKIRQEVSDTAAELAKGYGAAYQETLGLAADIAATGKTGEELIASTKETTRLAILGEVDRQEAMKATLAIQTAFKQNTEELTQSINFLNAVENQTSTTLSDLVEAIPKAGPVIKGLGGSVKDLALYITAMREGGISASEGANALKSGLASLINPTNVAVEKFQTFGIDLLGIVNQNAGNVTGTILELQSALDKLDPLQKQQAIEQLFGKFQFSRLNALFNNLGKEGSQTLQVIDLMKASTGELATIADRELKQVTESASGRYRRAIEGLKADLASIGDGFLNIATKIVGGISKLIDLFEKMPEPLKRIMTYLAGFTAVAGPIIMLTGVLGNFFGYIIKGVAHFRALFKGAEGWKLLTPEIIAANQAGNIAEKTFYNDAKAAAVLKNALSALIQEYTVLQQKAASGAISVGPSIATMAGNVVVPGVGSRQVDPRNPLAGPYGTRASAHMVPRNVDQPGTFLGMVPSSIPVNQLIGEAPMIYAQGDLPNIPGLTSISRTTKISGQKQNVNVSTGIISQEAAKWHSMNATLAMMSQQELAELKASVAATGVATKAFMDNFDDVLPAITVLTNKAATESAQIVAELQAGKISVAQAKQRIIALNVAIEQEMGSAVTGIATSRGRAVDLSMVPTLQQSAVDPSGKSNMRQMFRGASRSFITRLSGILGVRTSGAGYNIGTTIPRRLNSGGYIYNPSSDGAVVPGPSNVNFDIIPSQVPVGGYVLNQQASRNNPDLVRAAQNRYQSGGQTTPAILTPGETLFDPEFTAQNFDILEAANKGSRVSFANAGGAIGGLINSNKMNYGKLNESDYRRILRKYVEFVTNPQYEDDVRIRSIMLDASELSKYYPAKQAIDIATSNYDEAKRVSRGNLNRFAVERQKQLLRLNAKVIREFGKDSSLIYTGKSDAVGSKALQENISGIKQAMIADPRFDKNLVSRVPTFNAQGHLASVRGHFLRRGHSANKYRARGFMTQAALLDPEINTLLNALDKKGLSADYFNINQKYAIKQLQNVIAKAGLAGFGGVDDLAKALVSDTRFPSKEQISSGKAPQRASQQQRQLLNMLLRSLVNPRFRPAVARLNSGGVVGGKISRGKINYGVRSPLYGGTPSHTSFIPLSSVGGLGSQSQSSPMSSMSSMMTYQMLGMGSMMGGSMVGGAMGGQTGSMVGSVIGSILPSIFMATKGAASLATILRSLTIPGLVITGLVTVGKLALDYRKKLEDIGKANRLAFGGTEESFASVGIKNYKTISDTISDINEQLDLHKAKVRSTYESYTKAGPAGLTLTIKELREAIQRARTEQTDYVEAFNNVDTMGVTRLAAQLKAQFVGMGMSVEDATNQIYAIIKASEKANQAVGAISSIGFKSIKDSASAIEFLTSSLSRLIQDGGFEDTGAMEEFARGLDTLIATVDRYQETLIGTKLDSGEIVSETDAIAITLDKIGQMKGAQKELDKETIDDLKSQNLVYANILGNLETMQSISAKIMLYKRGFQEIVDLSEMNAKAAINLARNLDIVQDKLDEITSDITPLGQTRNPLYVIAVQADKAKKNAEAATAAVKQLKKVDEDYYREKIKQLQKLIDKIDKEREARLKVLDVQEKSENFETQLKQAQIRYKEAIASGNMAQAAQEQLSIQQLVADRQRDLARDAINDRADKEIEKYQKEIERLQEQIDRLSKAKDIAGKREDTAKEAAQTVEGWITKIENISLASRNGQLTENQKQEISNILKDMLNSKDKDVVAAGKALKNDPRFRGITERYVEGVGYVPDTGKFDAQKLVNAVNEALNKETESDKTFKSAVSKFDEAVDKFKGRTGGTGSGTKEDPVAVGASGLRKAMEGRGYGKDKIDPAITSTDLSDVARKAIVQEFKLNKGDFFEYNGVKYRVTRGHDDKFDPSWSGNWARRQAMGGYIVGPGTGTSDSIPAMLSNGEYVIRAEAVKKAGLPLLDKINGMATGGLATRYDLPKMATGGRVMYSNGGYASTNNALYNIDVTLNGSNLNPEDVARAISKEMKMREAMNGISRVYTGVRS